ncbi:MAG: DUF2442 domain-containing protein [Bifidobacteriaceae bacterium]|jgi:hypothetical protein|nr:DUF2442 domain-containing protein [Bifidobacteriaceae bacterium]
MHVSNGIAYAGAPERRARIVAVRALDGARLELVLSDGDVRVFDVAPFLQHAVYAPLAKADVFREVQLDHGVPTWMDGQIDFSPDTLLARSYPAERT